MIQLVRAFAWLRWRLLINTIRGGGRRDAMERFSRAASVIVPIILGVMMLPLAFGLGVASAFLGWQMGRAGEAYPVFLLTARGVLGVLTGVIILSPIVRSIQNTGTGSTRFTLLPIPRRLLHTIEFLSGLADPWIGVLVPALVLLPVGLLAAGSAVASVVSLAAGLLLLAILLGISSALSSFLQWIFRSRRRGEVVTLVVLLALSLSGFVPMLLGHGLEVGGRRSHGRRGAPPAASSATDQASPAEAPDEAARGKAAGGPGREEVEQFKRDANPWIFAPMAVRVVAQVVPSEMYVRAVAAGMNGRSAGAALPLAGLALAGAALYAASWVVYRRVLETPAGGGSRRGARELTVRAWEAPGLGPAASAVAVVHVRSLLRTVQGKMLVFFSPLAVTFAGIVFTRVGSDHFGRLRGDWGGSSFLWLAAGLCLLSMQKIMLNQYSMDGAGLTLQFLSPVSDLDLVKGKAAGTGLLFVSMLGLFVIVAASLAPGGSLLLWAAPVLGALDAYIPFAPVAALLAAVFPRPVDLNRMGSGANPSGPASLLGMLATALCAGPPALLTLAGMVLARSPALALGLLAVWTCVAAAVSIPLFRLAAAALASRRENLAMVAQGR